MVVQGQCSGPMLPIIIRGKLAAPEWVPSLGRYAETGAFVPFFQPYLEMTCLEVSSSEPVSVAVVGPSGQVVYAVPEFRRFICEPIQTTEVGVHALILMNYSGQALEYQVKLFPKV